MRLLWPILFALIQTTNATISGTASDPTGARVPNAQITLENIETGVSTLKTTNESGVYVFPSVPPGHYRVTAEAQGFAKRVVTDIAVQAGGQLQVNVPFALAATTQAVEVSAQESPLLSVSASVEGVINERRLFDLPLPDRDAFGVVLTQPGLVGANFAGSRIGALNVTRQGINVMDQLVNTGVNSVISNSVDVIDEVRVITSPVDAEFGRGSGQVQLAERSGTNQFHGSIWNFHNDASLNANDFFSNLRGDSRSSIVDNRFGGRLGGPIIRKNTFFNFTYEGIRQRIGTPVTAISYTDTARQGIFRFYPNVQNGNADAAVPTVDLNGNPVRPPGVTDKLQPVNIFNKDPYRTGVDPTGTVARLLSMMPLPNNFRYGDGLNYAGYTWRRREAFDGNQYSARIDRYLFNDRHVVSFSFSRDDSDVLNGFMPQVFPSSTGGSQLQPASFFALNVASNLSSTKLNEFHAGAQRGRIRSKAPWEFPDGRAALPTANGQAYLPIFLIADSPLNYGNDPQGRISPMYVLGDKFSWTMGKHTVKFGGEMRARSSDLAVEFGVMPRVSFGLPASLSVPPIQGVTSSAIPGLDPNEGAAQAMLLDFSGSVARIDQVFNASGGENPVFRPEAEQRLWRQREISLFVQDDFKLRPGLTVNLGLRYEFYGVPWDARGRAAGLVGGSTALFGISGKSWADRYQPGLSKGDLTRVQLVGKGSSNPNTSLYGEDYNNFAPVIGLSWAIPYFGKDKTVLRAGYSVGYEQSALVLLENVSSGEPGLSNQSAFTPTGYVDLRGISLPLKPSTQPLAVVPLTDRNQGVFAFQNDLRTPYVQNWNLTIERELPGRFVLDLRYVGSKGTKLIRTVNVNEVNIFENKLLDAFKLTQAGGNASLFDQIFLGYDLGLGRINGRAVTGSASLRAFDQTRGYFANNDIGGFADFLNRAGSEGDYGFLLRDAGLPENWIVVNPQFAGSYYTGNFSNSTYHSFQLDLNKRFSKGYTVQSNYTWSRALGDEEGDSQLLLNSYRNGRDRHIDKRLLGFHRTHVFRNSGIWELPFGPNRMLLGNSHGPIARLVEGWQFGGIFNLFSGGPDSLYSSTRTFNQFVDNTAVLVGPLPVNGHAQRTDNGVIFFPGLKQADDPSIALLTTAQLLRGRSSLKAITDANGNFIAVNPLPGSLGTMSQTTFEGPGSFRFDINLIKRVHLREGKELLIRGDAINLLNRPVFGDPDTDINSTTFGRITSAGGARSVVVSARVNF